MLCDLLALLGDLVEQRSLVEQENVEGEKGGVREGRT